LVREIAVFWTREGQADAFVDAHTALTQRPEFGSFGEAISPHVAGQPEVRHVEAGG